MEYSGLLLLAEKTLEFEMAPTQAKVEGLSTNNNLAIKLKGSVDN